MEYTISTHNGSKIAHGHNVRMRGITDKEAHIDPNGLHETWLDINIADAYEQLFGDAVRAYNAKQKRSDRKIDDYYATVKNDSRKHVAYEMIVSIGDKDHRPNPQVARDIMLQFAKEWKARNPGLALYGAYYHADEAGVPHVHLDYIPVAKGYTRGMERQNGLAKALESMGFVKNGRDTAQIQWERRENEVLESMCRERGLDIIHPQKDKHVKHQEKKDYIRSQEIKAYKDAHAHFMAATDNLKKSVANITSNIDYLPDFVEKRERLFGKTEYVIAEEDIPKLCSLNATAQANLRSTHRFMREVPSIFDDAVKDFDIAYNHAVTRILDDERESYERKIRKLEADVSVANQYKQLGERYQRETENLRVEINKCKDFLTEIGMLDYYEHQYDIYKSEDLER